MKRRITSTGIALQVGTLFRLRSLLRLSAALLVCVASALTISAQPGKPSGKPEFDGKAGRAPIEKKVLKDITDTGQASFWVVLHEQADLKPAHQMWNWHARGAFVHEKLTGVANRTQQGLHKLLQNRGVSFKPVWIVNAIYVTGNQAILDEVAARPEVREILAPRVYTVPTPMKAVPIPSINGVEWGIDSVKASQVWADFGVHGEGIVVCNIDTGVQYDHPALVNQYRGNLGGGNFDHNYNWYDPSSVCGFPSLVPCDNAGHGTHTMGTMVGDDGAGNQIGVAPGARWIAAKGCEGSDCSGYALTACAEWILAPTDLNGQNPRPDLRPNIVNNSWGGGPGDPWYQELVRAWIAAGIWPSFSVGNAGEYGCGTAGSPGDYPESYAAGAFDASGQIAYFSSRGPSSFVVDGVNIIKPNIAAPGVSVRSSVPGSGYDWYSGTSMASPHVAGTVALLWSASPALVGDIANTRALLDQTAIDTVDTSCGGTPDNNNVWGEGMLDILAAVTKAPRGDIGSLSGTVTDSATGLPIAGVTIQVAGPLTRTTLTDANGEYSFPALLIGSYGLTASSFGYASKAIGSVLVATGQTTVQDIALQPLPTVRGQVIDASDGLPLPGATIELTDPNGLVRSVTTDITGFYRIQVPLGVYSIQATAPRYEAALTTVTLETENAVYEQNFALRTAGIELSPASLSFSLLAGQSQAQQLTLSNPGGLDLSWQIEETGGRKVLRTSNMRLENASIDPSARTTRGLAAKPAVAAVPAAAGAILKSWRASNLDLAWGLGYNGNVWLSDLPARLDREFNTEGVLTGKNYPTPWAYNWAADMAYDSGRQVMYQVGVGDYYYGNSIYVWDLATGNLVAEIIDPSWYWTQMSHRGVAYRADNDTLYIGGWNWGVIFQIKGLSWDNPGEILNWIWPYNPYYSDGYEWAISGLAWDPAREILWEASNSELDSIYGLDAQTGEITMILSHPNPGYNGAGLETDENGNLWLVSQNGGGGASVVYLLDTSIDVPWLSENPTSGSVPADGLQSIDVTVDASALRPGVYRASLTILNNSGRRPQIRVPVTLSVSMAFLQGYVRDANNGLPIQGANVQITQDGQLVRLLATDSSGFYETQVPLGTCSVQASKDGYSIETVEVSLGDLDQRYTADFTLYTSYLEGHVIDANANQALGGATVEVSQNGNIVRTLFTAEDGSFSTQLPPGSYAVQASKTYYSTESQSITLESSTKPYHLDFVLRSAVIDVSPQYLSFTLPSGQSESQTLTLRNYGSQDLLWELAKANSFVADFNAGLPAGSSVHGSAYIAGDGGVGGTGVLRLTDPVLWTKGLWSIDQPASGADGFTANFKIYIGEGESGGADGMSFNFSWYVPDVDSQNWEEGSGSGLSICFDTWDNGYGEAPAIDLKIDGYTVWSWPVDKTFLRQSRFVDVSLLVTPAQMLTLTVDNQPFFENVPVWGIPAMGYFAFGARTGGASDKHWVDDLSIMFEQANVPWLTRDPMSGTVAPGGSQAIQVTADTTGLDVGTYSAALLLLNNSPQAPRLQVPVTLSVSGPYLQGHVVDANNGLPIAGATVVVSRDGLEMRRLTTDPNGFYQAQLPLGNFLVVASKELYGTETATLPVLTHRVGYVQDFALRTAYMRGRITDANDHQPLDRATVNIYDNYGGLMKSVVTDSSGSYVMQLPPGQYRIEAAANLYSTESAPLMLEAKPEAPLPPGIARRSPLADTMADWSTTGEQGKNGWSYGYYDASSDPDGIYRPEDFVLFPHDGQGWSPTDFWNRGAWDWFNGDPPWTQIGQEWGHPNSPNGVEPDPANPATHEHWAIRRWISTIPGKLNLMCHFNFRMEDGVSGDGAILYVLREGSLVYGKWLEYYDTVGADGLIYLPDVKQGERIDLAVAPGDTDYWDHTLLKATIFSRPPATVQDLALRTPRAMAAPASLNFTVTEGQRKTMQFALQNLGGLDLNWKLRSTTALQETAPQGRGSLISRGEILSGLPKNINKETSAAPFAFRWQPAQPTANLNILAYADDFFHSAPYTYVDQALQRLGLPYVAYYGDSYGFENDLRGGTWDLVLVDHENWPWPVSAFQALNEYALSGGKLVCNSWQMDGYSDHPLWRTMGVSFRFGSYWPDPVFWWNPTHPAFNDPETVPEFTELLPVGYGIYGQHVEPLTGFEAVAGYTTPGPDLDQAALVIGNDGRTVFKAFADGQNSADRDADGTPDGVELWENLIAGIQTGFVPPVPWLTAEPASGTQRPTQPQHVQVTVDATQLRPGTYSATLVIRHNSGRSQKLVVPVSVKVLPFKVALKAGGPAYTDNTKEEWAADQAWSGSGWGYSGSSSALTSTTPVGSTADPKLYATARQGQFEYRFDVPAPGTYRVELRFAEFQNVKPGTRVFNVRAEGNVVLPRHDIANEVGNYKADNHSFNINVGDGQLNLRFEPLAGQKLPIVNAIRVTRQL